MYCKREDILIEAVDILSGIVFSLIQRHYPKDGGELSGRTEDELKDYHEIIRLLDSIHSQS